MPHELSSDTGMITVGPRMFRGPGMLRKELCRGASIEEFVTLDTEMVSLGPTLGVEMT